MTSLAVGVVLTLINHGGEILRGQLKSGDIAAIGLTFLIPFVVATSSSVAATVRCGSARIQAVGRPEVERP